MGVQERAVGEWKDSEGNSYCDQINDDNKSKKCFSYHIYLLGVKCDICRDVQEEQVAIGSGNYYVGYAEDEEAKVAYDAGRVVKGPSNKRCPCGHCGARGCCRCAEEEIAERGAAHYGRERTQDSSLTSTYTERPRGPRFSHEKAVGRGRHAKKNRRFSHEKAVARADRYDEEEMCIRECGRRGPNDYERCKNSCVRNYGRQEKAVGGSWENGKCMSYGSYLTDAGATVNDMGTGWSESSCQSECDYSSTTKACQYEFSSQRCLMFGFYDNNIYGAGDYDALCYVK